MSYQIVVATPEHVEQVAAGMREADRQEVYAASGMDAERALRLGAEMSRECYAGVVDGEAVCIFGVAAPSMLSSTGVPWMLGTDKLERHANALMRVGRRAVAAWMRSYDLLENYVDSRNTKSIQWLCRLGFTIHDAEPRGPFGLPFHRFTRRAHV